MPFTIIRAGGLLDAPGGERELLVTSDDQKLMNGDKEYRSLPRADVAEMCVRAIELTLSGASDAPLNRSMDLVSKEPGEADPTSAREQFVALFEKCAVGM